MRSFSKQFFPADKTIKHLQPIKIHSSFKGRAPLNMKLHRTVKTESYIVIVIILDATSF